MADKVVLRLHLVCDCGNRDDLDLTEPNETVHPPVCSGECGRTMRIDWVQYIHPPTDLPALVLAYEQSLTVSIWNMSAQEREVVISQSAAAYRAMVASAKAQVAE